MKEKIEALVKMITEQTQEQYRIDRLDCETNMLNAVARVKPGNKYTKIDVGSSGKLMVDAEGNIFGIKAYGVIHRGHAYGTLDTINNYWWGKYYPCLKEKAVA